MIELIVEKFEGSDENGNSTHLIGHVLNDPELRLRCVIPWLLRGKSGNIKAGSRVVAERFQDGSGLVIARKDGGFGQVIYGSEIKLGSDSASDYVALTQKVLDNLTKINDAIKTIATHTHEVASAKAKSSTELTEYTTGLVFGDMSSSCVKAK